MPAGPVLWSTGAGCVAEKYMHMAFTAANTFSTVGGYVGGVRVGGASGQKDSHTEVGVVKTPDSICCQIDPRWPH